MRAISVAENKNLEIVDVSDPVLRAGEVLVRVAAAGVNRADVAQRAGLYPPPPGESDILGLEVSGRVEALADDVDGWAVGDEVCALLAGGGYAELVAVPAGQLLAVPAGHDLIDAAGLPEAVCTAWSNLVITGGLGAGETVLIHGGSGGVGSVGIQLALAVGARVLTTAGGPERTAQCVELGAHVAIDYRSEDVVNAVMSATDGRGADVILDILGGGGLDQNVRSLAPAGRLVIIGAQQGFRGEIDLGQLLRKRASVHATTLRARPIAEKSVLVADVNERVWPMLGDGRLRAVIDHKLPLAEAERAHELLNSSGVFGKVLLIP